MAVIGIGIDAIEIDRVRRATAEGPRGRRFRERVFTPAELGVCDARRDPSGCLAVRFAAKEAVMKALGAEGISFSFREIEVVRAASGKPSIVLHGRVAERAEALGVTFIHVSLTHAEQLALASVVVEGRQP